MNRRTNGNEQSQRTITWVATFLSLALLVASLALALGSGEAVAQRSQTPTLIPAARPTPQGPKKTPEPAQTPSDTKTISIKASHQNYQKSCEKDEVIKWHFVITQIAESSLAPGSITAQFQNAGTVTIGLGNFTGGTAHYTYYTSSPETLIDASATIYAGWRGEFNLSRNSTRCVVSTPETTPVGTPEPTRTPPRATPTPPRATPTPVTTPVGTPEPTRTPPRATPTPPRATPSPVTTPVSESAGATATPTSVSEALPATAEPTQTPQPPAVAGQVLPKTGGGPGGSILVGLLGLVGSVLAATGFALEARRRRAMR
jgi:uncharacterized iron-regulated membrane protein